MQPPVWFQDSAAKPIMDVLRWFIAQLNNIEPQQRRRPLTRKLTARTLPALFDFSRADDIDFLQEALQELAQSPYSIWTLSPARGANGEITLTLNYAAEPILRGWLNMPRVDPAQQAWLAALETWPTPAELDSDALGSSSYPGIYPPGELLTALTRLVALVQQKDNEKFTWRRLSAHCFWGDSKYLDSISRQQWLLNVCPQLQTHIESRTLLLNVFLVDAPQAILLIENQDTFCWLMKLSKEVDALRHLHLVYSQGFMGSAQRSRDARAVQFMYQGSAANAQAFHAQWLQDTELELPIFFWGDLDYAGMSIIKSLRQVFPALTAWKPGYQPMLAALREGAGHTPEQAGKAAQLLPEASGCEYTDQSLLPGLIETGRFIDQEWVTRPMLVCSG